MNCEDCGAELTKGTYYCGGCGRPVGFDVLKVGTAVPEPGLDEVPEPAASMETSSAPAVALETPFKTKIQGKGLCGMCMGAFPDTVLSVVDGKPYCPDCSPVATRCREPEVREPELATGGRPEPHPDVISGPLLMHETRSGSGAKGLVAIFVLVLLGGMGAGAYLMLAGDRIDELMSGLDTSRKDAYLLAQSYVPGESMYYEVRCGAKAAGEVTGLPIPTRESGDFDGKLELLGGLSIEVLKVDRDNNAQLAITTDNFDVDIDLSVGGAPVSLGQMVAEPLSELRGKTVISKVDAFGNPLDGESSDGMQELLNGGFGEVPSHHIRVGDTWSASVPLGGGSMSSQGINPGDAAFVVKYRVEGFKEFRGRDCMAISVTGGLNGGDDIRLPIPADLKFDLALKGVAFYDVALGRLVKVAMDVDIDFGAAGPMGGAELGLEMEMDVDLR